MPHEDHPDVISRNARIGLILFAIYVALYAGFMALATFYPQQMAEKTPFGSVNVAIVYGMGLIFAAFILAGIYVFTCRGPGKT